MGSTQIIKRRKDLHDWDYGELEEKRQDVGPGQSVGLKEEQANRLRRKANEKGSRSAGPLNKKIVREISLYLNGNWGIPTIF